MPSFFRKKMIVLGLFIFVWGPYVFSQNSRSYFYENGFGLSFPVKNGWSMDSGAGYKGLLQKRIGGEKISGSQHEHLEVNHFTNYETSESLVVSLGLRYRFKEFLDPSETNEFRIIEQVEIDPANSSLPLSHRFRLEQRYRENTEHRIRYELAHSRQISGALNFIVGTEVIYSVSANLKPEAEQRFAFGLKNGSFKDLELGLSFEYRMENYARDLAHEFFLITGLNFVLD